MKNVITWFKLQQLYIYRPSHQSKPTMFSTLLTLQSGRQPRLAHGL